MSNLTLESENTQDFTFISNSFIDDEMCDANGDFVKVYLYLLRCSGQTPEQFSISFIADRFNLTEKDVLRALRYWEKKRLIALQISSNQEITGIRLKKAKSSKEENESSFIKKKELSNADFAPYTPNNLHFSSESETKTKKQENTPPKVNQFAASVANAYQSAAAFRSETAASAEPETNEKDNKRLQEILFLAEQYIGKPLTPDETMKIYYFYDTLHFSPDLIEYLIEYCVTNNKKNMRYIEKVALTWADKGIATVSQAREESSAYSKDYFTILKAFGIRDRYPVDSEIAYMEKWLHAYHFELDIITEACARTMKKGHQSAPFPYADTILTNWHKRGVITKKDIFALDSQHQRAQSAEKTAPVQKTSKITAASAVSNQFNNFEQRSSYDYDELEKKLSQM